MKKICIVICLVVIANIGFSQIKVFSLNDTTVQVKKNSLIYYLPQTFVSVNVDVKTKQFIPGPFCKYAEKYLSIEDVKVKSFKTSDIIKVELNEYNVVDPKAGFFVTGNIPKILLDNRGLISSYNNTDQKQSNKNQSIYENYPEYFDDNEVYFTDYSVKRNFTGITDTTYKVIELDSVFQKIPVYNTVITSKDFEQKAEEAANYIIKIRKRRFKLQSAQFENEKPPKKVEFLVNELNELEKQYLELFIGKEVAIINSFHYTFKPAQGQTKDRLVLFHLSDENGISDKQGPDTEPVYLNYSNCGLVDNLQGFYSRQLKLKDKTKGLYYRIPGQGLFSVEFDKSILLQKHLTIPQYGLINYLPVKMFKNKNLQIIFDVENGSIVRICNE
ncbi:MAG: DUF4831 family protein [Bacteroidales bacterium]|nr:DUF4831 family protein [Bacteroidales bacterium]